MKWITRQNAKVDRVACPWLIKRFIDPGAEFVYVPADRVLEEAKRLGARSFDAEGAEFGHGGNTCTFESLVSAFRLTDAALHRLARIVHGADIPQDLSVAPEAAGLLAISEGLATTCHDDHRKLELMFPIYDALYAHCKSKA
jgi:hypothetical protein